MARRRVVEEESRVDVTACAVCGEPVVDGACANGHREGEVPEATEPAPRRRIVSPPPPPPKSEPAKLDPRGSNSAAGDDQGRSVTVVWGKELFSPKQFHTYEVGPFTATVMVRTGETLGEAAERAMEDLRAFAERERDRKRAAYLRAIG